MPIACPACYSPDISIVGSLDEEHRPEGAQEDDLVCANCQHFGEAVEFADAGADL